VVRIVISGKVDTTLQATKKLNDTTGMEVSGSTMLGALKETELKTAAKKRKPRLLPRHIRERMGFALCHPHCVMNTKKEQKCEPSLAKSNSNSEFLSIFCEDNLTDLHFVL